MFPSFLTLVDMEIQLRCKDKKKQANRQTIRLFFIVYRSIIVNYGLLCGLGQSLDDLLNFGILGLQLL